ncbi:MAG: UDP-4-amino-4,6-dideoxy-N-acetyl-beta-L-altrosamine N-acetyltransferase [Bacteroidales bacterium]|nr:UDP-4-amino-4,6-dideoxy-N-acetyl-beta-L-altrosamine N-acetyltransferase [Bacteroidales bacterium]
MKEISNSQTYSDGEYTFRNFTQLGEEEKKMIWEWRNHPAIRQWMADQGEIPLENHLRFIESLKDRKDRAYWLVEKNGEAVGVADFVKIDYRKGEGEPGYYLSPANLNSGLGLEFNYHFRHLLFHTFEVDKFKGYILIGNERAFLMSLFFGLWPFKIYSQNGKEYIMLKGSREDFDKVNPAHLTKDFVRHLRANKKVDWTQIKSSLQSND